MDVTIDEIGTEGEIVAVRERGCSVGSFRGQAPTGRSYEIVAMAWFPVRAGSIRRRWGPEFRGTVAPDRPPAA
jgi:hypothetical protein